MMARDFRKGDQVVKARRLRSDSLGSVPVGTIGVITYVNTNGVGVEWDLLSSYDRLRRRTGDYRDDDMVLELLDKSIVVVE